MEGNRVFAAEFDLEEVAQPAMNFEQRLKVVEMRHAILVVLTPKVAPVYVPPRDHAPTEAEKEWMSLVDVAASCSFNFHINQVFFGGPDGLGQDYIKRLARRRC